MILKGVLSYKFEICETHNCTSLYACDSIVIFRCVHSINIYYIHIMFTLDFYWYGFWKYLRILWVHKHIKNAKGDKLLRIHVTNCDIIKRVLPTYNTLYSTEQAGWYRVFILGLPTLSSGLLSFLRMEQRRGSEMDCKILLTVNIYSSYD